MYIHNFYSDLLLSTRILFDQYIFHDVNYIKKYEFNYGNRTFQLDPDYRQNYEFPVVLVNLNSPTASFGQRLETIRPIPLPNINHTLVLYNKTNNKLLYLQEEQTNVGLSITFNCESQFQAREIEHVLTRYLPLNKFINLFSYTSFLEITDKFLHELIFDINNHEIVNLFDRLNTNTGRMEHFFAVNYQPLLRNDSITSNITDSTQRSFQVTLELTYNLQLPIFLFDAELQKIENININLGNFGYESISDYPVQRLTLPCENEEYSNIRRQLLFSDPDDFIITNDTDDTVRIELTPHPDDLKLLESYTYNFINNGKIHKDVPYQFFEQNNKVIFDFPKAYFEKTFEISYTKPLIIQIIEHVPSKASCSNNLEIGAI